MGKEMTVNTRKVLAAQSLSKAGMDVLKARGDIEVISFENAIKPEAFHALLADAEGVILSLTPVKGPEVAAAPKLKVAARIGVGYDTVDVAALTPAKIVLMIAGTANSPSVAEQAFSMMFHLAKRNQQNDAAVRGGSWRDSLTVFPSDLFEKNLLVVGFGRIGSRTAKRGVAFEMKVTVYDPYVPAEKIRAAGCEPVTDLDAAVAAADFISVHCPKNPETINLFDAKRLGRMKPTAIIVNTARGGIVNEAALYDLLVAKKIAGAGLDVFEVEPAPLDHPLLKAPNVIVAPHLAGVTKEALDRMSIAAARNVLSVLDGNPIRENAINPEVLD
jgi:D-3-phosphoglycerate dehydrogenase